MKTTILVILMLVLTGTAYAETAVQRLNRALKGMDSLSADFKQTLLDDTKQVVQVSSGQLAIQRPGKFFWQYRTPYEQSIIADGEKLWTYDADLGQVTVKPMRSAIASAPIMILMKQNGIEEEFRVSEVGQRKFLYWIELKPKSAGLEYSHIYIGLEKGAVKAMELRDSFAQSTQIVFENLQMNVIHDPKTFQFKPPAGSDVFGPGH